MASLTYNGVTLSYILSRSVSQGPDLDSSNTDQLYTRTRIEVQALLNAGCLPAIGNETPASQVARIRHLLTAPRRPLTYSIGNNIINLPGGLDDANGPFPDREAFRITEFSPSTFLVTFAVTVRLTDCGTSPPAWLSNRWSESNSYDANWYAVKKRTGELIVSSRGVNSPDDLRGLVTTGIEPGFRRETADYEITPDGLHYRYTFVDRQLAKTPPLPATALTGRQIESTSVNGGKRHGEIHLTLSGPPTVPPRDLMNAAIRVAMARVFAADPQQAGNRIIIDGSITENLDDTRNDVGLSLRWQMRPVSARETGAKPPSSGLGLFAGAGLIGAGLTVLGSLPAAQPTQQNKNPAGMNMFAGWLGQPLRGSDPARGIAPPTRGTLPSLRLVAAALKDPCGQEVELRATIDGVGTTFLTGTTNTGAEVFLRAMDPNQPPDDNQALYTGEIGPGVYETYLITNHYRYHGGRAVLPPPTDTALCSFPQVHGAYMTCKVEWSATRTGQPPVVPGARFGTNQDDNAVYLDGGYSPDGLDLAGDGVSVVYKAAGWQLWGFKDWKKVSLSAPVPPFLDLTAVGAAATKAVGTVSELIAYPSAGTVVNPLSGQGVIRAALGTFDQLTANP